MRETLWTPAIAVLASGLAAGGMLAAALAARARRRRLAGVAGSAPSRREAAGRAVARSEASASLSERLQDLQSRKAQLLEQLRDLQDTASAPAAERAELEQQAAMVLRELAEAERGQTSAAGHDDGTGAGVRLGTRLALVAGVLGLVGAALWSGTRPRSEGMGITGGLPGEASSGAAGGAGQASAGGNTPDSARPITARPTPRLSAARKALEAQPDSLEARVELGYALAEAGGWIELYQNAEALLARDPENADALIQSAMLRFAMRQPDQADALIAHVLEREPENVRALEVGGRLALGAGNWPRAADLLGRAVSRLGPDSGLEAMLEQARENARAPASAAASAPPTPPVAPAAGAVQGVVTLGDGVTVAAGAALFVMARPAGMTAGPPVAALRLPATGFPVRFRLDSSHAMMGGSLPDTVTLSARLDADGHAATKQAEDLVGSAAHAVKLGAAEVEIVLRPAEAP